MKPLITKVVTINQQNEDPNSAWAKARFNWLKQLAIRFRILDPQQFKDPPLPLQSTTATTQTDTEHQATRTSGDQTTMNPSVCIQQSEISDTTDMIVVNRQKDAAVVAAPKLTLDPTTTIATDQTDIHMNLQKVDLDGIPIPKEFDTDFLPPINRCQIAWWDETHPKVNIGSSGNKKVGKDDIQIRFPRDEDGNVEIKKGIYNTHVEKK